MHAFNLNLQMARSALRDMIAWRRAGLCGRAASCVQFAVIYTRRALSLANRMHDRKRAGLCLKILNWLRADLRRLAA